MKKAVFLILGILAALVITGAILIGNMQKNLDDLVVADLGNVDLDTVPDGTYVGKYSAFPIIVEVEVTVRSGVITLIEILKHQNGQGAPAEVIVNDVLVAQSLFVDAIAGATYSSRVILFAIRDALVERTPAPAD
jgi:uncharacterized protein with FMN-binding domain